MINRFLISAVCWMAFTVVGRAALDLPAHGFKSKLPGSVEWKLTQETDDARRGAATRAYEDPAGDRSIMVRAIKTDSDQSLEAFVPEFKKGILAPGTKIKIDRMSALGLLPARMFVIEAANEHGVRRSMLLVGVRGKFVYVVTLAAKSANAEEDKVFAEFLRSVKISTP